MESPNHPELLCEFSKIIDKHNMFIDLKIKRLIQENVNSDEISVEIKSRLFTFFEVVKMVNRNVIFEEHSEPFE